MTKPYLEASNITSAEEFCIALHLILMDLDDAAEKYHMFLLNVCSSQFMGEKLNPKTLDRHVSSIISEYEAVINRTRSLIEKVYMSLEETHTRDEVEGGFIAMFKKSQAEFMKKLLHGYSGDVDGILDLMDALGVKR